MGVAVQAMRIPQPWTNVKVAVMFLLVGPKFVVQQSLWIPIPAAVATAWVLYSVHRAFEERK